MALEMAHHGGMVTRMPPNAKFFSPPITARIEETRGRVETGN